MQCVQYADARPAQHPQRIGREQQDSEHDRQAATDQGVVDAFVADAAAWQCQHQDRRHDGLIGEHHSLPDETAPDHHRKRERDERDDADLHGPGAEQPPHQGARPDPQGDADHHLDGALAT